MAMTYTGDQIAQAISCGDSATAQNELNRDFQQLLRSPAEFKAIVDRMLEVSSADKGAKHHVLVERDGQGNPTAIDMTNEVMGLNIYSTSLFRASDQQATASNTLVPTANFNRISRIVGGALQQ